MADSLLTLKDELVAMISADAPLAAYINNGNFYFDIAVNLPAITLGGFNVVDDKVGTHQFQLALLANHDGNATTHATFLQMCQRLKALLNANPNVVGGAWIGQNEPQNKVLRSVFPCTTYLLPA